jgi:hypothetical protein
MPRLPNPAGQHRGRAIEDELNRLLEVLIDGPDHRAYGCGLGFDHLPGKLTH